MAYNFVTKRTWNIPLSFPGLEPSNYCLLPALPNAITRW